MRVASRECKDGNDDQGHPEGDIEDEEETVPALAVLGGPVCEGGVERLSHVLGVLLLVVELLIRADELLPH